MNNFIFFTKDYEALCRIEKFTLTLLIVKRQGQWRSGRD